MKTHFVPPARPGPDSLQRMVGGIPEPNYSTVDPSYSREIYQMRDSIPAEHSLRPTHLPVNYDCGYINDLSYQSRLSPACESSGMASLFELQDTPLQNGYLDPELCDGLSRGLNIHKSFPLKNPNKISESGALQKAQRDLAWRLKSRLTADDLISKGILLGREQSPHILHNRMRLERAKTVDILKKKILARPPKGKLIDGNILKEFSGSPRLHQCQMSIKRKQIMKQLNEKISERPRAQALIKRGILCPPAPPLNECLRSLKPARNADNLDSIQRLSSNNKFYTSTPSQDSGFSFTHSFSQTSSPSAPGRGYEISQEERSHHSMVEESSPDCSIVEESIIRYQDTAALDAFSVLSKFPPQDESEISARHSSLSKRINVRNPVNESTLKKDLISSSSLKTRSGRRPRKGIKTYKYHEYIPCSHSGNGLAKSKILEKTHLTKTALSESKGHNKTNLDMEVHQEQLLLQLHLLRQQYPSLMPKVLYNDLVTQLSQIEGKDSGVKRRYTLEELDGMTVTSLKMLCKEHSVPSTGKKAELLMRLKACNSVITSKSDEIIESIGKQISNNAELEGNKLLEAGVESPGKGEDEQISQVISDKQSRIAPQECIHIDQINSMINSPLSDVSQYSGQSSDSYDESCNSTGKGGLSQNENMSKITSISDPDHNLLSNGLDSLQGVDANKFLDEYNALPNGLFMPDNTYTSTQCEYQRISSDDANTKKHLFKYPTNSRLNPSSSLPVISGYQHKMPTVRSLNKLNYPHISEDSEVSEFLHQLDSIGNYEMNLNNSLPAYQHRNNSNFPYEDQYYTGGIQTEYNPMKPMANDPNSYLNTPYLDNIACPPYAPDMNMEWSAPNIPQNDLFYLNEPHYDINPLDFGGFDRSGPFQDIYHNSVNNSIDL